MKIISFKYTGGPTSLEETIYENRIFKIQPLKFVTAGNPGLSPMGASTISFL